MIWRVAIKDTRNAKVFKTKANCLLNQDLKVSNVIHKSHGKSRR